MERNIGKKDGRKEREKGEEGKEGLGVGGGGGGGGGSCPPGQVTAVNLHILSKDTSL